MRRSLVMAMVLLAILAGGGLALAAPKPGQDKPRPQANPPANRTPHGRNFPHHDVGVRDSYFFGNGYLYGYGYGYYDPIPCLPFYSDYPYAYPPLYVPADPWFGPQATQRFMGMGTDGNDLGVPWSDGSGFAPPPMRDDDLDETPEPKRGADRGTNAQANALAWKYLGYGDAQFAKRKYAEANDRYRKAAISAPQLGAAYFRQAFALSAIGRYDLATAAVKRGLKLDPAWPKSAFDLDELFGDNEDAKNEYFDKLIADASDKPNDPNLLFMLGVFLHFDGQTAQATRRFERALRTAGVENGHIQAFLEK